MVITSNIIKENLKKYSNKNTKITRDVNEGKYIRIINGLFETNANTPGYLIANSIYGPSYISFECALSYYGLIPKMVTTITSATFDKKKRVSYTIWMFYISRCTNRCLSRRSSIKARKRLFISNCYSGKSFM